MIVRRWLQLLREPDRLNSPEMRALLQAHGRLPLSDNSQDIGRAAAKFLKEMIGRLKPPPGAPARDALPYRVLVTCFLEGAKLSKAAMQLEISERQLTRERARAISLLVERMERTPTAQTYYPEAIPAVEDYLPRPDVTLALGKLLEQGRVARVHGPAGIGKTTVVAEYASNEPPAFVWWYRFRRGVNDSLKATIFELAQWLNSHGAPQVAEYVRRNLAGLDERIASRITLQALAGTSALIVLDDFPLADQDPGIGEFFEEIRLRAPAVRIVAISRYRPVEGSPAAIEVPPLDVQEVDALLKRMGVQTSLDVVAKLHLRTGGNPHLIRLAGRWVLSVSPDDLDAAVETLSDHADIRAFLLADVTDLLDRADKRVLEAASVFRSKFSDDALGYVAQRTRGEVEDVSQRLVRSYIATRSRHGAIAFLHTSVRDYVYERLDLEDRATLHLRAAAWYHLDGDAAETAYHRERAGLGRA